MKINKNISSINIFSDRDSAKTKISERARKIKSEDRTKSSNDTLVQLSDYLHLKTKSTKLASENYTSISDGDQAQPVLDETKSQSTQNSKEFIVAQANSNSWDVYYLLG
jgi:hypothetical protein